MAFASKVVLVTGVSSGIGRATAEHLVSLGHRVFGTARRAPLPDGVVPPGVEVVPMNVDDDASVRECVPRVIARAGRIDAVVNNAGYALAGPVEDTTIDEAKAQFETNFFGVLRVIRAVLPVFRAQGGGYVINISSLGGVFGMPFSGLYSATKFAVEGMTEALRLETRAFGVRVVLIEPGDVRTGLPAARRNVQALSDGSPYLTAFERTMALSARDEAKAPAPDSVAKLIGHVLAHPSPRVRYSVGMPAQRVVLLLKWLLPSRLFEWILRQAMGL